ncbi:MULTISPECIES: flavin reductase family protein [unclassified Pseudomonas]|uniref:flavin reductase family protein n=1 Tax=unclassified Pseudomonas TaxID=196821 RepID=UPI00177DD0C4|nr:MULTISPECIES: flavin reductase family protein [unclassified Pseudomonas]MBD8595914.1 flavin reductase family protein [Pseudomonas sp. CFBP 8758]MBD8733547.1 flavin reductase family protein [Pseudomonas sp. CFBP 13710]
MASSTYSYSVADGHGLPHDPLPAILGPRPIGWISTVNQHGRANLAPYSFFNIINYRPPILIFSSVGKKDSVRNAQDTGHFVYNLATRPLAELVNDSSTEIPGIDEFEATGLTPVPSIHVASPRVAESPVSLECEVTSVQQLSGLNGRLLDTWMVMGEVVGVHINSAFLKDGVYDTASARPILRGGGPTDYFEILKSGLFHMTRPK